MLIDRFGRLINYLRISVTNQCNLNCIYCRPLGTKQPPSNNGLSCQEIVAVVHAATQLGISHIRLTGGEPLLRTNLPELIQQLSAIPGATDLSLTTNGQLLADLAEELAAAGHSESTSVWIAWIQTTIICSPAVAASSEYGRASGPASAQD